MLTVPIHEAKAKLSALIAAVEKGDEVVLTRHGKRVVRLTAEAPQDDLTARRTKAEAMWERLQELHKHIKPAIPGETDWRSLRDAGRS